MKLLLSTILLSVLIMGCSEKKVETQTEMTAHKEMPMAQSEQSGEKLIYYTCPMESHKHVHSSEPGTCPECGMTLVEGVVTSVDKMAYYGCPMLIHSHVRQAEPGRCPECKMELKPMRLKTTAG